MRVSLEASGRSHRPGSTVIGPAPSNEPVTVTVVLRRERDGKPIHDAENRIKNWASSYGLKARSLRQDATDIVLMGTSSTMQEAFGTKLYIASAGGVNFRQRTGTLSLPENLAPYVSAVLGLDDRPQVRPHSREMPQSLSSLTPDLVARAYNVVSRHATDRTVGVLAFGGGYSEQDVKASVAAVGAIMPAVHVRSVANAPVDAGRDPGSDLEVVLDLVCLSGTEGILIELLFAPPTTHGYYQAIAEAIYEIPTLAVLVITWGNSESEWTAQAMSSIDQLFEDARRKGILICTSCGDSGSANGVADGDPHVDFPASSPNVLAVGGTVLRSIANDESIELVWNDAHGATGGGVSNVFPRPSWQPKGLPSTGPGFEGRGVPDIAAPSSPGYQLVVNGKAKAVGGTSASAPVAVSMLLRAGLGAGSSLAGLTQTLYGMPSLLRAIDEGTNDVSGLGVYRAAPGWNACCGLGRPDGRAMAAFRARRPNGQLSNRETLSPRSGGPVS